MEIREARPEEYAEVGDLTVDAYVRGGHVEPDDDYVHRLRDAAGRAAQALLLVAVDRGDLVGTVTYCPHGSPWREIATETEGEFRTLAVGSRARGRGVGSALVLACIERSRGDGDAGLVLSTLPDQETAHGVYERAGFRRDPGRDWSPVPGVSLLAYRLDHAGREVAVEATREFVVTDADTAVAVGSGTLPVLGTPRLLAWCEAATCAALEPLLPEGATSVGTRVALEHVAPSVVGERLSVTASRSYADRRLHRFTVAVRQVVGGRVVATGEVTRVVVDAERFLQRGS
jgi:predicted thioesterase/GNAT superfamily N-acetyltransferase